MRIVSTILLIAFVALLFGVVAQQEPSLKVRNSTNREIVSVEVQIAGHSRVLPGAGPGQEVQLPVGIREDGPLEVLVRFRDGSQVDAVGGYFTPGMRGGQLVTVVHPDSLHFGPLEPPSP